MSIPATPKSSLSTGVAWLVAAVTLFVCMDSLAKYMTTRLPVTEIVWARYAFHLAAMVPVVLWKGVGRVVVATRPGLQFGRSMMLVAVTVMFNIGFRHMPLATVTAISFGTPLVVTALAVPLLKETVDRRRWAAVLVGFAGVLVVVRPTPGGFDAVALFPLAGAVFAGFYQLATRALSGRDSPLTTIFWTGFGGCLVISPVMPFLWQAPDPLEWAMLAGYGVLGFLSHFMLILAYRHASASDLAPFFYVQLLLAMLSGLIFFHNAPDIWMLAGTALICTSGLYVWYSQRRRP